VLDCSAGRVCHVAHGCIETKAGTDAALRLLHVMESLRAVVGEYRPDESAVEILYFGKNVSSGIPVAESRGVIFAVLAESGIPVAEFRPNAVKQGVTGVSSAGKRQVQEMVRVILGLDRIPKPDHAADALAVAICAANGPVFAGG